MFEPLDRSSELPLWVQLRNRLRDQIKSGKLGINAKLPTEAALCETFGVSRAVSREAMADLVRSGLAYRIKGSGAYTSSPQKDEDFISMAMGFSDEMASKGNIIKTQVLHQSSRAPNFHEATLLGISQTSEVTALRRLRSVDGVLRLLVNTVVPSSAAPGLHKIRLEDRSLYEVLRRQYGVHVARAERWIDTVLPDEEMSTLLKLDTLEPLLRIESVAFTKEGRAVEHYIAWHRCKDTRLHIRTQS